MPEETGRKHYVVVNHYVRQDQYEWLRQHGNHSVLMRELIDGAMYNPSALTGAQLAELHETVRKLDELLTTARAAAELGAAERRNATRQRRRGGGWHDRDRELSEAK